MFSRQKHSLKVSYKTPQVSGLKYGAKYNYRVFAENAAGVSEPSNIIGPLLADDLHGERMKQSSHSEPKRFKVKSW